MLKLKKTKASTTIFSAVMAVTIILGSSLTAFAAAKDFPQATPADSSAEIEAKDTRAKSILADDIDTFVNVSDQFRQDVKEGKVQPISQNDFGTGAVVSAVDENGQTSTVNLEADNRSYCDHSTTDVYIYVHKPSGSSCNYEKWNGIKCTKCGTTWKMDMLSSTYYPSCPH